MNEGRMYIVHGNMLIWIYHAGVLSDCVVYQIHGVHMI